MIDKIKGAFGKKKEVEPALDVAPTLMASDPVMGDNVDLMAADPVNAIPYTPPIERASEWQEMPGLESQLTNDKPAGNQGSTYVHVEATTGPMMMSVDACAFSMPGPQIPTTEVNVEPEPEPTPVQTIMEKGITSKICMLCATPNDILAKVCTSCGVNMA